MVVVVLILAIGDQVSSRSIRTRLRQAGA